MKKKEKVLERKRTLFYKILNKVGEVVYVGVTLRTLQQRFNEHLQSKKALNNKDYSIVEFDRIEHPLFASSEVFYQERKKVVLLERKYIQEEKDKGAHLLNLSP